jgi:hypothetical protein
MSDGMLTQGYLFPLRQYSEAEVLNFFALSTTGLNGQLVAFETGNQNPELADGYSNLSVGASFTNIVSNRYLNNRRVRPAVVTDFKSQIAGVTLHTTAEYDENGQKLVLLSPDQAYERGFVPSGFTTPVLQRGYLTIRLSQIANSAVVPPLPGYVLVPTGAGAFCAMPASTATGSPEYFHRAVGSVASTSGANNGGYVQIRIAGSV